MYHFGQSLSAGSDPLRPGIVHRLDKDTSGLIIVAKDDRTHSLLSTLFQERKITKIYKAIIVGKLSQMEGTIETFIERSKKNRKKMAVSSDGKLAITHYKIVETLNYYHLADIKIDTGRTHQIRVHMAHINCPVFGDKTYSSLKISLNKTPISLHRRIKKILTKDMQRQALHAYKLEFIHPITNKTISVISEIPEDMSCTWDHLTKAFKI